MRKSFIQKSAKDEVEASQSWFKFSDSSSKDQIKEMWKNIIRESVEKDIDWKMIAVADQEQE